MIVKERHTRKNQCSLLPAKFHGHGLALGLRLTAHRPCLLSAVGCELLGLIPSTPLAARRQPAVDMSTSLQLAP